MPAGPAASGRSRFVAWTAVVAWTVVILTLSTDSFSAGETSRIVGPLLDLFFPGLDPAAKALIHGAIRKLAHFVEYAVLGGLAWHALALSPARGARRAGLLALLFGAAVACADEAGQALRSERTGSLRDAALDVAGAGFGISLCVGVSSVLERRRGARAG